MKKRLALILVTLLLVPFYQNCIPVESEHSYLGSDAHSSIDDGVPIEQKRALYETHCSSCHGSIKSSNLKHVTVNFNNVKLAIVGISRMNHLGSLSDENIRHIVDALNYTSTDEPLALCTDQAAIPTGRIFRLSKEQYANTLNSLFKMTNAESFLGDWPSETVSGAYANNGLSLDVNELLLSSLVVSSESILDSVWNDSAQKSNVLSCDLSNSNCASSSILEFLERAFRRPVIKTESDSFLSVYSGILSQGASREDALKATFQSILVSPSFIYNIYVFGASSSMGHLNLASYELANRLSYTLWGAPPDAELLQFAQGGGMSSPNEVAKQVRRMLKDSRSSYFSKSFFEAWILPERLLKHASKYTDITSGQLKEDMLTESKLLFEDIIQRDAPLSELINSSKSYVNARLASHYGISGVSGTQFREIQKENSIGILGHAGILSLTARDQEAINVIHRGKWVLDTLLCQGPPPPMNVEEIGNITEEQIREGLDARAMANFRSNTGKCAVCHKGMDGFGFALENFNSLGQTRSGNVDSRGLMPDGTEVNGSNQLNQWLNHNEKTKACFARQLASFSYSRPLQEEDICVANRVGIQNWDQNLSEWIVELVMSRGFQEVR